MEEQNGMDEKDASEALSQRISKLRMQWSWDASKD